jgi:hypothetical protein
MIACNEDGFNHNDDQNNDIVAFNAVFDADAISTRASDTIWARGDGIGVFTLSAGTNNVVDTNKAYVTIAGDGKFTHASENDAIYYPVDPGERIDFIAYYPYKSGQTFGNNHINIVNQAVQEDIDFLYSNNATDVGKSSTAVPLSFSHVLSKMVMTVKPGYLIDSLTGLSVKFIGMNTSADVNLATGVVGNKDSVDYIVAKEITTPTASVKNGVYEAILLPDTLGEAAVVFTLRDTTYFWYITESIPHLSSAKKYVYTITINSGEVEVEFTQNTIDEWDSAGVNRDDYLITVEKDSLHLPGTASEVNKCKVSSNSPSVPTIALSNSPDSVTVSKPDWITDLSISSTGNAANGWTNYVLTFGTTVNETSSVRTGYIHLILDGETITVIKVEQGAIGANSYILAPGSAGIEIPVARAVYYGGASGNARFDTQIIWDDNDALSGKPTISGVGEDARLKVTPSLYEGNAVVAVIDEDSVIRWSYHIWVTGYDPNTDGATFTNTWNTNNNGANFVFMDRNLGAKNTDRSEDSYGLFYQWGRKDPFPSPSYYGVRTLPGPVSISDAIRNPDVFYTGVQSSGDPATAQDWLSVSNPNLWNDTDGCKTVYDPCPAGWRVPAFNGNIIRDNSPWKGFSDAGGGAGASAGAVYWGDASIGGITWGENAKYPAAGYRSHIDGTVDKQGGPYDSYGYYWSASPKEGFTTRAGGMVFFDTGDVRVAAHTYKANGLSVRCVKE